MNNVGAIVAAVLITAAVSVAGTLAALYFGIKWLIGAGDHPACPGCELCR